MTTQTGDQKASTPFTIGELNTALRAAAIACLQKTKNVQKASDKIAAEGLTILLRGKSFTVRVRSYDQTLRELAEELHIR